MFDLANNISTTEALEAASGSTDRTGSDVDLKGFEAAAFAVGLGKEGITLTTANRVQWILEHGDATDDYAAVTSNDEVTFGTVDSNGVFALFDAPADAPGVKKIGYIGNKRYVRVKADFRGTHGAATITYAVAVRGCPHNTDSTTGSD